MSDALIDRLTDNERECLERVLDHQTAKEMARDLGISHHAVEKRLKRTRERLGAATSLEAARRYGETVSGSPDLIREAPIVEDRPEATGTAARRNRKVIAMISTLILAGAATFWLSSTPLSDGRLGENVAQTVPPAKTGVTFSVGIKPRDGEDALSTAFRMLDKDRSETISTEEFIVQNEIVGRGGAQSPGANAIFAYLDRDNSNMIERDEWRNVRFTNDDGATFAFEIFDSTKPGDEDMSGSLQSEIRERLADAEVTFIGLDKDKSGSLTRDEWIEPNSTHDNAKVSAALVTKPADGKPPAALFDGSKVRERRSAIFDVMDRDEDGLVDRGEFMSHTLENSSRVLVVRDTDFSN